MDTSTSKIMIIDDEDQIRNFLRLALESHSFEVCEAATGTLGIAAMTTEEPNLLLLDLELPDMSGLDVLRHIRTWSNVPVIVLSVRDSVQDIVNVLDHGANDYLTKPFHARELIARIHASLRQSVLVQEVQSIMHFKHLTVDFSRSSVYFKNKLLKLTKKEYQIICCLAKEAGKIVTQKKLLTSIWGKFYQDHTEYLRTYIMQLRKKIEVDFKNPEIILTETGVGYRFIEPNYESH